MEQYENKRTYDLITAAKAGDKDAKEQLVSENMGLVYHISSRFYGRGVEKEDIHQLGAIGLLAAIDKFDISMGTRFSTYAVPMILGEIRRFFRDDGMMKVSRSMKTLSFHAMQLSEKIRMEQGTSPTVCQLAEALQVSCEELTQAMESSTPVCSFSEPVGDNGKTLGELLPAPDETVSFLDRLDVQTAVSSLPVREQTILHMRYIHEKSQAEIAKKLGISQVQVSRLERKILEHLRNLLNFSGNSGISGEKY